MITINKNPPLLQLLQARRTIVNTDEPYDALDTDTKDAIRRSLCEEQGYLCAYCMRRIEPTKDPKTNQDRMKIEHWLDRSTREGDTQLDYSILLGVCCGKTKYKSEEYSHCDDSRGSTPLKFNPANLEHHSRLKITYSLKNGKILSEDEEFGEQLNNVLNLNNEVLLNNRLSVLNGVQDSLERLAPNTTINQTKLQNFLNKYQSLNTQGKKHPYCGIVIYYLQRKLKATNS